MPLAASGEACEAAPGPTEGDVAADVGLRVIDALNLVQRNASTDLAITKLREAVATS
jgi:hypothetical protein